MSGVSGGVGIQLNVIAPELTSQETATHLFVQSSSATGRQRQPSMLHLLCHNGSRCVRSRASALNHSASRRPLAQPSLSIVRSAKANFRSCDVFVSVGGVLHAMQLSQIFFKPVW